MRNSETAELLRPLGFCGNLKEGVNPDLRRLQRDGRLVTAVRASAHDLGTDFRFFLRRMEGEGVRSARGFMAFLSVWSEPGNWDAVGPSRVARVCRAPAMDFVFTLEGPCGASCGN